MAPSELETLTAFDIQIILNDKVLNQKIEWEDYFHMFLFSCFKKDFRWLWLIGNLCWKFTWHFDSQYFQPWWKCFVSHNVSLWDVASHSWKMYIQNFTWSIHPSDSYRLDFAKSNISQGIDFSFLCYIDWQWTWIPLSRLESTQSLLYWCKKFVFIR